MDVLVMLNGDAPNQLLRTNDDARPLPQLACGAVIWTTADMACWAHEYNYIRGQQLPCVS